MAEKKGTKKSAAKKEPVAPPPVDTDESERTLGRAVGVGLPVLGIGGAIGIGFVAGLGSGILVLAAAALLGTIAFLWASVRTLSGDAPLSLELEALAAQRVGVDALAEQKIRVLRALKDLESEHALGKIDDADYERLVTAYRDEAKGVMRKMDLEVEPRREEAEKLARAYLKEKGLAGGAPAEEVVAAPEPPAPTDERRECPSCKVSNEADAAFCKKCGTKLGAGREGDDAHA